MKKVKYVSNARWTKVGKSSDQHGTKKMAEGVCDSLMELYGPGTKGCETRGHCIEAWAEIHVGKSMLEGLTCPIDNKE